MGSQHMWLHPPVAKIERFVKHHLKCKAQTPAKTSACVVVPAFHSARWRQLLQSMQLLKKYPKGSMLFAEAGQGKIKEPWGPRLGTMRSTMTHSVRGLLLCVR